MLKNSYVGQLIAANPLNPRDNLSHSVILIVAHTDDVCVGLRLDAPLYDLTLSQVSDQIGVFIPCQDPIYNSGPSYRNKIHVVHSADWNGLTTVPLNEQISISTDIGVLAAISQNQGPEKFIACSGFCYWPTDELDAQITAGPNSKVKHRWEQVPATESNVFGTTHGTDYWRQILEEAAQQQAGAWSQSFSGFN